jgi:hypothetical protein
MRFFNFALIAAVSQAIKLTYDSFEYPMETTSGTGSSNEYPTYDPKGMRGDFHPKYPHDASGYSADEYGFPSRGGAVETFVDDAFKGNYTDENGTFEGCPFQGGEENKIFEDYYPKDGYYDEYGEFVPFDGEAPYHGPKFNSTATGGDMEFNVEDDANKCANKMLEFVGGGDMIVDKDEFGKMLGGIMAVFEVDANEADEIADLQEWFDEDMGGEVNTGNLTDFLKEEG